LSKGLNIAAGWVLAVAAHGFTHAAPAESPQAATSKSAPAKAEQNRKKPLQRCDELADKAQLDCLQKARQSVVEARKKREASSGKGGAAPAADKPQPANSANALESPPRSK
jgi:hypothetical protein